MVEKLLGTDTIRLFLPIAPFPCRSAVRSCIRPQAYSFHT